ncbi:13926_t:CDS:1, partial [Funneliformis geosporum]
MTYLYGFLKSIRTFTPVLNASPARLTVCLLNNYFSTLKPKTMANNKDAFEVKAVNTTERLAKLRSLFKEEKYNITA